MNDTDRALLLKEQAKALALRAVRRTIKDQGLKLSSFIPKDVMAVAECLLYDTAIKALITQNYEDWNGN